MYNMYAQGERLCAQIYVNCVKLAAELRETCCWRSCHADAERTSVSRAHTRMWRISTRRQAVCTGPAKSQRPKGLNRQVGRSARLTAPWHSKNVPSGALSRRMQPSASSLATLTRLSSLRCCDESNLGWWRHYRRHCSLAMNNIDELSCRFFCRRRMRSLLFRGCCSLALSMVQVLEGPGRSWIQLHLRQCIWEFQAFQGQKALHHRVCKMKRCQPSKTRLWSSEGPLERW